MHKGALNQLPPQEPSKEGGLRWLKSVKPMPVAKKAAFSIPKMKQVAKLAKGMGKNVTDFTVNGDGGFTVTAADPATITANQPSEWD